MTSLHKTRVAVSERKRLTLESFLEAMLIASLSLIAAIH